MAKTKSARVAVSRPACAVIAADRPRKATLARTLHSIMRDTSSQGALYSQTVAHHLKINSADLKCLDYVLDHAAVSRDDLHRPSRSQD